MNNKLLKEISDSIIESGKKEIKYGDSEHNQNCRNIYLALNDKTYPIDTLKTICVKLLESMNQKPTESDVDLLIANLKDKIK